MKTTHTPGPWRSGNTRKNWFKVYAIGERPLAIIQPTHARGKREKEDFDIEGANCKLIAAAPALLEALENLTFAAEEINKLQHAGIESLAGTWAMLTEKCKLGRTAISKAKEGYNEKEF